MLVVQVRARMASEPRDRPPSRDALRRGLAVAFAEAVAR